MKTLRLNFPNWQGATPEVVTGLVTELPAAQAIQGYYMGARLVNWLLPKKQGEQEASVPVSLDFNDCATENGIFAYQANLRQQQAAMRILRQHQLDKVVTIGGDCAASVAPFSYLADKYADETAIIWIDAHPDLGLPYDDYTGFHAMALAQIAGFGDPQMTALLPERKIATQDAMIVGLRYFGEPAEQRRKNWGIETVSCEQANMSSQAVLDWLTARGKSKVLIHLDLDVLDPQELKIAVGTDPNGMSLQAVSRVINDIATRAEIVDLTVAEPMPREVIKLKGLLDSLPL
ncbi:arginase family protein [Pasteurellaceae bacterium LIM206]|nr:arginase family protein [Pasteurellaceae bacterium LIM206]